jgi:demethylmenaquinone methyltransferase/2-methoxy-6-polyprenyl-1,4-benzoquinol methylase
MAFFFDRIARLYDHVARPPDPAPLLGLLRTAPGGRVLDLGGGTGRVGQVLAGRSVTVCDLSAPMARRARDKGLLSCQGRAEALPFASGVFDAVLAVDAFHHFAGQEAAVREMLRVVQPGGRVVVVEPDIRHPVVRLVALAERLLGLTSHMRPAEDLGALFQRAGGQVVAVERLGRASFGLVVSCGR